ncbi:MAG: alpha/beta hydrolase [Sphingobium sp. 32-64-5]|nr:MAG: alpha/beta hydrolase [Sphingobium sp. 32-64-5]
MTSNTPVYLLPGLLCDASVWTHQQAALAAGREVVVPDFTRFSSIGDMAQSVLDAAPERFCVAGHSMGARVAIEIVRRADERVERLALLDTGAHPPRADEPAQRQALIDLAFNEGMEALAGRWLPPMVHADRVHDASIMDDLHAMVLSMSPDIYRRQVTALLGRADAFPSLRAVTCPTLVGVGRQDRWSPPAQHEAIVEAVPHARYVIFEDSGHMSPVEAPEAVTAALLDWLAMPALQTETQLESAR